MDSSNSQHSLSQPTNSSSNPTSGSASGYSVSCSDSQTRTRSGGSISPSTENNPPEGDNSSSSMQMNSSSSTPEDVDVNMEDSSTSTKPLTGKEKVIVDTETAGSSNSREGKEEEIGLLVDLYNLHNKTGRYALISEGNEQREFYKFWIQEEGDYANKKELDEKINELHERFLKNMDKNVEGPTDTVDVEILRLSEWIWGAEIVSSEEETDHDDDDHEQVPQDSSDVNVRDDVADHKDSSKERGGLKDSSSKPNGKGSAAS